VSWSGVITDVTELREARTSLAELELCYASLVNSSSEAIVTVDSASTIISVNPRAEREFGYLSHELVGHPIAKLAAEGHPRPLTLDESDAGRRISFGVKKRDGEVATFDVTVVVCDFGGRRQLTGIMSAAPFERRGLAAVEPIDSPQSEAIEKAEAHATNVLIIARQSELDALVATSVGVAGLAITCATTVGLGLELAKRTLPDALLIVEGLPDSDTVSALEAISSDNDLKSIPVVVLGAPLEKADRLSRFGAKLLSDRSDVFKALLEAASLSR
jgi:PAS domain S-box-containing protein